MLSPFELPDRTAYPLLERLIGSTATLFFSTTVENGCLWIPALARGKRWFASNALRPSEFADTLGRALDQFEHEQTEMGQGAWRIKYHAQHSAEITSRDQVDAAIPQTAASEMVFQPQR